MEYHIPVLLQSVLHYLDIQPNAKYIDATFGGGGHSAAIISAGGLVLGIDQDPDALSAFPPQAGLKLVRGNFTHIAEIAKSENWQPVSGILFDLGLSSRQIENPARGFSFQNTGPLDMRMDPQLPNTAATLVNILETHQLADLISRYGEIKSSKSLAEKIVAHRPYSTTTQLAEVLPAGHIQRVVFQSLRIAVNDELNAIDQTLPQSLEILAPAGVMVVISFHSLEDRLVKNSFRKWEESGWGTVLTKNPVTPDQTELSQNPRSHSAKLRAFKKT